MDQLGVILGVAAIGGGLLVYALLFLRNGREYREALNEVYVRDPDDLGCRRRWPATSAGSTSFGETIWRRPR